MDLDIMYKIGPCRRTTTTARSMRPCVNTKSSLPNVPLGLTDACRLVLRNAVEPLTALGVRDRLAAIGIDLDKYSNPLASIHTVLKRLHEGGEIAERDRDEPSPRTAYAFVLPRIGLTASHGKLRVTGQGLCPPKDRKK